VDDHLSGKVIEFNPACCLRNYSETMLSELEKKGYIVSTETDQNKIRIKPLGINEIVLSSKMTEMKHEMIMVCLDMDAHQHSYELDENVLEE
jgi:NOL1/NOP2/fmu family ribosome biogenesis protein